VVFINKAIKNKKMKSMKANATSQSTTGSGQEPRWPFTAWMSRAFMTPPTLIFTLISLRFITNPVHAIAAKGVSLTEPEAVTDTRVIGAITLVLVVLMLSAIFSRTRLRLGHLIVVLTMGLALSVRFYGFMADGATMSMGDQAQKTIGEIVFLILNSIGLIVQTIRLSPARQGAWAMTDSMSGALPAGK
jgi:hypothetical protein